MFGITRYFSSKQYRFFGNHLPCAITRITFYKIIPCLKFNYGNTANNSLTIFQAEKRIIHGCKYPGRFVRHSHDFFAVVQPHTRAFDFGYFSSALFARGLFLICTLCKIVKEQKRPQTFSSMRPGSKVCRIELHTAFKLRSKNSISITSKATKKPLPTFYSW